jgi:hypothetical protein
VSRLPTTPHGAARAAWRTDKKGRHLWPALENESE